MNGHTLKRRRRQLREKYGDTCWICGDTIEEGQWSIDHLIPLSRGGGHGLKNLRVAHKLCNERRANPEPETVIERCSRDPLDAGYFWCDTIKAQSCA